MPVEILLLLAAAKAALLLALALLVARVARRASAALRHAILLAAVVGALLVPLLGATLPTLSPLSLPDRPLDASPDLRRWSDNAIALLLIRNEPAADLPVHAGLREAIEGWRVPILGLWCAGTLLGLTRILLDLAAVRRSLRRARRRGHLGPGVPLLESAEVGAPVVVGVFRRAIMVPEHTRVDPESLGPALAHELAHVRRRDCLTQLVVRLACAFYWFNPLVWSTARRVALERERACDDQALAEGADPIGYAELLIEVARRSARTGAHLQATSLMAQPAHLEQRILGILDASATRGGLSRGRILLLATSACLIVAPLAAFGMHDRPSSSLTSDPFGDPGSERVEGVRTDVPTAPPSDQDTADGALIAVLHEAAARSSAGPYDLVPDRARWALSLVRQGRVIEPLLDALADPDWRVRAYAAWALSGSGDARAVEPLIPLLDHPVWRVRAMAATALRTLADPRAASALAGVLDDPAWQVRVEAVAGLGELRPPGFMDRIEPLRADAHLAVRLAADEALNRTP